MTTPDAREPLVIADGVFWLGARNPALGLRANAYLVTDGDEAVLIDGGSRPDFPLVMVKLLETGVDPARITRLIVHHYDPDLCGSLPNFEEIIGSPKLRVISRSENAAFIEHYGGHAPIETCEELGGRYRLAAGRVLEFHATPYAHAAGSFITFDPATGTLFSSDLFGSAKGAGGMYLDLDSFCANCPSHTPCPRGRSECPIDQVIDFHRTVMPSSLAIRRAMEVIAALPVRLVAPQHGSLIRKPEDIRLLRETLAHLEDVGIERLGI